MMPQRAEQLRNDLAQLATGLRSINMPPGGWLLYAFVAQCGQDCVPQRRPQRFRQGRMKACFHNSRELVRRHRGLSYVEGYAMVAGVPFPLHHAWAIDGDSRVIDITLTDPELCAYVGVVFSPDEVIRFTLPGSASLLLDAVEVINVDLIRHRCPDLMDGIS